MPAMGNGEPTQLWDGHHSCDRDRTPAKWEITMEPIWVYSCMNTHSTLLSSPSLPPFLLLPPSLPPSFSFSLPPSLPSSPSLPPTSLPPSLPPSLRPQCYACLSFLSLPPSPSFIPKELQCTCSCFAWSR